ncbi:hypothetical protein HYH03_006128 [Edaphochlamys debaryana]|uniref:Ion transport domain-containing protein n=1 Tax=Edaphochlamys debaryana TaxID=47281 RepID=A0A835YBL1_9CHLO|nr:hypothetical protein HYH03_006128 [Edaphochlamys debaryana]|eukprot:KAG2495890.1 hypothetical protein HYH03_006128 [Edaphochlamys debaryana]
MYCWNTYQVSFGIEYVAKLFAARNLLQYIFWDWSIIDLITVMFGIVFFVDDPMVTGLGFIRLMRVIQVIRLLKVLTSTVLRYSRKSVQPMQLAFVRRSLELALTLLGVVFISGCVFYELEVAAHGPDDPLQLHNAIYWSCVTIATIGYGDYAPITVVGQCVFPVMILVILLVLPQKISNLTEVMRSFSRYMRRSHVASRFGTHVVLTGHVTPVSGQTFVGEFFHPDRGYQDLDVIILCPRDPEPQLVITMNNPQWERRVRYLNGSPFRAEDLARADASRALAVFVMANKYAPDPAAEDRRTLLTVLAIAQASFMRQFCSDADDGPPQVVGWSSTNWKGRHKMSPHVQHPHIVVQFLLNSTLDNAIALLQMGGKHPPELGLLPLDVSPFPVCIGHLRASLLGASMHTPGVITLVSNLCISGCMERKTLFGVEDVSLLNHCGWLSEYLHGAGVEIYDVTFPPDYTGKTFREAALKLWREEQVILIGLRFPQHEDSKQQYDVKLAPLADWSHVGDGQGGHVGGGGAPRQSDGALRRIDAHTIGYILNDDALVLGCGLKSALDEHDSPGTLKPGGGYLQQQQLGRAERAGSGRHTSTGPGAGPNPGLKRSAGGGGGGGAGSGSATTAAAGLPVGSLLNSPRSARPSSALGLDPDSEALRAAEAAACAAAARRSHERAGGAAASVSGTSSRSSSLGRTAAAVVGVRHVHVHGPGTGTGNGGGGAVAGRREAEGELPRIYELSSNATSAAASREASRHTRPMAPAATAPAPADPAAATGRLATPLELALRPSSAIGASPSGAHGPPGPSPQPLGPQSSTQGSDEEDEEEGEGERREQPPPAPIMAPAPVRQRKRAGSTKRLQQQTSLHARSGGSGSGPGSGSGARASKRATSLELATWEAAGAGAEHGTGHGAREGAAPSPFSVAAPNLHDSPTSSAASDPALGPRARARRSRLLLPRSSQSRGHGLGSSRNRGEGRTGSAEAAADGSSDGGEGSARGGGGGGEAGGGQEVDEEEQEEEDEGLARRSSVTNNPLFSHASAPAPPPARMPRPSRAGTGAAPSPDLLVDPPGPAHGRGRAPLGPGGPEHPASSSSSVAERRAILAGASGGGGSGGGGTGSRTMGRAVSFGTTSVMELPPAPASLGSRLWARAADRLLSSGGGGSSLGGGSSHGASQALLLTAGAAAAGTGAALVGLVMGPDVSADPDRSIHMKGSGPEAAAAAGGGGGGKALDALPSGRSTSLPVPPPGPGAGLRHTGYRPPVLSAVDEPAYGTRPLLHTGDRPPVLEGEGEGDTAVRAEAQAQAEACNDRESPRSAAAAGETLDRQKAKRRTGAELWSSARQSLASSAHSLALSGRSRTSSPSGSASASASDLDPDPNPYPSGAGGGGGAGAEALAPSAAAQVASRSRLRPSRLALLGRPSADAPLGAAATAAAAALSMGPRSKTASAPPAGAEGALGSSDPDGSARDSGREGAWESAPGSALEGGTGSEQERTRGVPGKTPRDRTSAGPHHHTPAGTGRQLARASALLTDILAHGGGPTRTSAPAGSAASGAGGGGGSKDRASTGSAAVNPISPSPPTKGSGSGSRSATAAAMAVAAAFGGGKTAPAPAAAGSRLYNIVNLLRNAPSAVAQGAAATAAAAGGAVSTAAATAAAAPAALVAGARTMRGQGFRVNTHARDMNALAAVSSRTYKKAATKGRAGMSRSGSKMLWSAASPAGSLPASVVAAAVAAGGSGGSPTAPLPGPAGGGPGAGVAPGAPQPMARAETAGGSGALPPPSQPSWTALSAAPSAPRPRTVVDLRDVTPLVDPVIIAGSSCFSQLPQVVAAIRSAPPFGSAARFRTCPIVILDDSKTNPSNPFKAVLRESLLQAVGRVPDALPDRIFVLRADPLDPADLDRLNLQPGGTVHALLVPNNDLYSEEAVLGDVPALADGQVLLAADALRCHCEQLDCRLSVTSEILALLNCSYALPLCLAEGPYRPNFAAMAETVALSRAASCSSFSDTRFERPAWMVEAVWKQVQSRHESFMQFLLASMPHLAPSLAPGHILMQNFCDALFCQTIFNPMMLQILLKMLHCWEDSDEHLIPISQISARSYGPRSPPPHLFPVVAAHNPPASLVTRMPGVTAAVAAIDAAVSGGTTANGNGNGILEFSQYNASTAASGLLSPGLGPMGSGQTLTSGASASAVGSRGAPSSANDRALAAAGSELAAAAAAAGADAGPRGSSLTLTLPPALQPGPLGAGSGGGGRGRSPFGAAGLAAAAELPVGRAVSGSAAVATTLLVSRAAVAAAAGMRPAGSPTRGSRSPRASALGSGGGGGGGRGWTLEGYTPAPLPLAAPASLRTAGTEPGERASSYTLSNLAPPPVLPLATSAASSRTSPPDGGAALRAWLPHSPPNPGGAAAASATAIRLPPPPGLGPPGPLPSRGPSRLSTSPPGSFLPPPPLQIPTARALAPPSPPPPPGAAAVPLHPPRTASGEHITLSTTSLGAAAGAAGTAGASPQGAAASPRISPVSASHLRLAALGAGSSLLPPSPSTTATATTAGPSRFQRLSLGPPSAEPNLRTPSGGAGAGGSGTFGAARRTGTATGTATGTGTGTATGMGTGMGTGRDTAGAEEGAGLGAALLSPPPVGDGGEASVAPTPTFVTAPSGAGTQLLHPTASTQPGPSPGPVRPTGGTNPFAAAAAAGMSGMSFQSYMGPDGAFYGIGSGPGPAGPTPAGQPSTSNPGEEAPPAAAAAPAEPPYDEEEPFVSASVRIFCFNYGSLLRRVPGLTKALRAAANAAAAASIRAASSAADGGTSTVAGGASGYGTLAAVSVALSLALDEGLQDVEDRTQAEAEAGAQGPAANGDEDGGGVPPPRRSHFAAVNFGTLFEVLVESYDMLPMGLYRRDNGTDAHVDTPHRRTSGLGTGGANGPGPGARGGAGAGLLNSLRQGVLGPAGRRDSSWRDGTAGDASRHGSATGIPYVYTKPTASTMLRSTDDVYVLTSSAVVMRFMGSFGA